MKLLNRFFIICAATATVALAAPLASAQAVLLIWDDDAFTLPEDLNPNTRALLDRLEQAGYRVTPSERGQGRYNGQTPAPDAFDVVVHLNGNSDVFDVMLPTGARGLAAYVQAGGGYVGFENTEAQLNLPVGFSLDASLEDLYTINSISGRGTQDFTLTKVPVFQDHPVVANVPNSFTLNAARLIGDARPFTGQIASVLMRDGEGSAAVAIREFGAGRTVSFSHAGNFSGSSVLSDPNAQQLVVDAVRWADQTPPTVTAITPEIFFVDTATFVVTFSEPVDGVNAADFVAQAGGNLRFTGPLTVARRAPDTFVVVVGGVSGQGTLTVSLRDNNSIVDRSSSGNALGGADAGDGDFTGEPLRRDTVLPRIDTFGVTPLVTPVGGVPRLTVGFSEDMNTAVFPEVEIITENNGVIPARPAFGKQGVARVTDGLTALYRFEEGTGTTVNDTSDNGAPLNLSIIAPGNVTWLPEQDALRLDAPVRVESSGAAIKIFNAVFASNAVTLEAWVRPANSMQTGPARVATISDSTGVRNITLGQDAAGWETRLRTTATSDNGIPALAAGGAVTDGLQHVVYTRASDGPAVLYVDGVAVAQTTVPGGTTNWNSSYPLVLGNEATGGRAWLGELHLVAFYGRALTGAEVQQNFSAGAQRDVGGDGAWTGPRTYQVSADRAVVEADAGVATVAVRAAEDLAGNAMAPDASNQIVLVRGGLRVAQQPPANVVAEAGETLTLRTAASGAVGMARFEWVREPATGPSTVVGDAAELVFAPLELDDSGRYFCVISDDLGSVQTRTVSLRVVAELPAVGWLGLSALAGLIAWAAARRRR